MSMHPQHDAAALQPLLPRIARLVASGVEVTAETATLLLMAAGVESASENVQEILLWCQILSRLRKHVSGVAQPEIGVEALRLRGIDEAAAREALALILPMGESQGIPPSLDRVISGAVCVSIAPYEGLPEEVYDLNYGNMAIGPRGDLYITNGSAGFYRYPDPEEAIHSTSPTEVWRSPREHLDLFGNISAVAIDLDGYIYAADRGRECIHKLSPKGEVLARWGLEELGRVDSIAVDSCGIVYVVAARDRRSSRSHATLLKLSQEGRVVARWGSLDPRTVRIGPHDTVYVSSWSHSPIKVYSPKGEYVRDACEVGGQDFAVSEHGYIFKITYPESGAVDKISPNGLRIDAFRQLPVLHVRPSPSLTAVVIDGRGDLYVCDASNGIMKLSPSGEPLGGWYCEYEWRRPSLAVRQGGTIYVADESGLRVQRDSGDVTGPRLIDRSLAFSAVAVDDDGTIYLGEGDRVEVLSPDGKVLREWGSHGHLPGQFNLITGIAVDRNHNVYVADLWNHRIQKFDARGVPVVDWGMHSPETPPNRIWSWGVATDSEGNVYATDMESDSVRKYSPEGKMMLEFRTLYSDHYYPGDIAVYRESDVYIYVTYLFEGSFPCVSCFDDQGALLGDADIRDFNPDFFDDPNFEFQQAGIAVDAEDRVWVMIEGKDLMQLPPVEEW